MCQSQSGTQAYELWDAKMLGQRLRLSKRQIFRLNKLQKLGPECFRIGGAVRWRADDIKAWLAAGAPARAEWNQIRNKLN